MLLSGSFLSTFSDSKYMNKSTVGFSQIRAILLCDCRKCTPMYHIRTTDLNVYVDCRLAERRSNDQKALSH